MTPPEIERSGSTNMGDFKPVTIICFQPQVWDRHQSPTTNNYFEAWKEEGEWVG